MKKPALKINWEKHFPPGFEWQIERKVFIASLVMACLWSLTFLSRFSDAVTFAGERGQPPYFYELLGKAFFCFPIVTAFMLLTLVMHYAYHHSGSKSIYLMRRLPQPWERHRRSIEVPLWSAVITLLVGLALFFIYYGIYMFWINKHGWHPYANQLELLLKNWSVM